MDSSNFFDEITEYQWSKLVQLRGNAHNSTIGFISLSWNRVSSNRIALDAPPTYKKHKGQKGNRYADLLLLEEGEVRIVVEVETSVSKYLDKFKTLLAYFDNKKDFSTLACGLMILLNWTGTKQMYKTNWDELKKCIVANHLPVALVSIDKIPDDTFADAKFHSRLLEPSGFFSWRVNKITGWLFSPEQAKPREIVLFS